ncbi:MAG: PTS sugar transporter subunit IIA [Dissulfuribacterales bacterium]
MRLQIEELATCLQLTVSTVERWIRQGRIPVRKKGPLCVFNLLSVQKWADSNNLTFTPPGSKPEKKSQHRMDNLLAVMKRGGVFYDVEGDSVEEVLNSAVGHISCFKTKAHKEALYESLLAREALMSTGIGKGVAIPHPRTPLGYADIPAVISTFFLKKPVNYNAVDKKPVKVLFVLVCPSSKYHLHLLARLSFCLRDEAFLDFLSQTPDQDVFFEKADEFDGRFDTPE